MNAFSEIFPNIRFLLAPEGKPAAAAAAATTPAAAPVVTQTAAQKLAAIMAAGKNATLNVTASGARAPRGFQVAEFEKSRQIAVFCPYMDGDKLHPSSMTRKQDYALDWPKDSAGAFVSKEEAHALGVSVAIAHGATKAAK